MYTYLRWEASSRFVFALPTMPRLLVIQHVPHETLGTLERPLREGGCGPVLLNSYEPDARWPSVSAIDGMVVMGGPMSAYQEREFPFLTRELALLRQALTTGMPLFGVCLGAQLIAVSLGARVMPNSQKEIGWFPIMREPDANGDELCSAFGPTEMVFQWHGDTYELPYGARRLFSSQLCREQAFRYRDNVYALQYHLEVTESLIREWVAVDENKRELKALRGAIEPALICRQTPEHIARLEELSQHMGAIFARMVVNFAKKRLRRQNV